MTHLAFQTPVHDTAYNTVPPRALPVIPGRGVYDSAGIGGIVCGISCGRDPLPVDAERLDREELGKGDSPVLRGRLGGCTMRIWEFRRAL